MKVTTADFERGMILNIDNSYWEIVGFQFVNPGKGSAFTRTTLKSLRDGKKVERTYKSGETFDEAEYEKKEAKFLYKDRQNGVFQTKDGQRINISLEALEDTLGYLIPNSEVEMLYVDGECLNVLLPKKVDLKVVESPPSVRGNSAGALTKTVTLETGLKISVPAFVSEGDIIRVNTEKGEYSERIQ